MKAIIKNTANLQDIFFPVRLESTSEITGMLSNPECVNSVVATIDGQDRVLATVGERYNLISNEEVFTPIMDRIKDYKYEVSVTTRNHSIFEVKFNLIDQRLGIKIGASKDLIFPQISLNRSYNSSSKYNAHVGYFRMVCSNGLVIPVEGKEDMAFSVKGKHTEKLSRTLEKIDDVITRILEGSKEIGERYKVLFDTPIENYGERVEAVMEATGIKKGKEFVMRKISEEMAELGLNVANEWLVYNGINNLIYNKNVKTDEVRRELDAKVMAEILK